MNIESLIYDQDDPEFTKRQMQAISIIQIMIFIVSFILLVILCINIFNYLSKMERYKDPSIVLFYVNSILIIFALVYETTDDFRSVDICPFSIIIDNYFSRLLNLNIGICEACIISTLALKLGQLLGFKESLEVESLHALAYQQLKTLNNKLRKMKILTISLNIGVFLLCIIGMIWQEYTVRIKLNMSESQCKDRERFESTLVVGVYE